LFYWLEILAFKVLGFSELSARLPSVFMGTFTVAMVFLLAEYFGFGLFAGLVTLTSIEFAVVSKLSITDMTLNAFITATLICLFFTYVFWRAEDLARAGVSASSDVSASAGVSAGAEDLARAGDSARAQGLTKARNFLFLAGVFSGLGCLAKGPVALALPGLVFLVFLVVQLKFVCFLKAFWRELLQTLAIFLVLVVPWFLAVHMATDGEFTRRFFFQENIDRFLAVKTGHSAPWFYYLPVFMVGFIPWIYFFPQTLGFVFSELKSGSKNPNLGARNDLLVFCCLWFAVIFLFFSFAKTKLTTYIIGVFAPASLLVGAWFFGLSVIKTKKMGIILGQALFSLSGILVLFICSFFKAKLLEVDPLAFGPQILFTSIMVLVSGVLAIILLMRFSVRHSFLCFALANALIFVYVNDNFIKPISFFRDSGTREFVQKLSPEDSLVSYGMPPERFEFYGKRQVVRLNEGRLKKYFNGTLSKSSKTGSGEKYLVFKTKDLDKLVAIKGSDRLDYVIKTKFFSVIRCF
jgi:4-amino-4-deoxy-L-arabinose transferase-like glycosyltransferase